MDEFDIMGLVSLFYGWITSIILLEIGFVAPLAALGYIPNLVWISLIIQQIEYIKYEKNKTK